MSTTSIVILGLAVLVGLCIWFLNKNKNTKDESGPLVELDQSSAPYKVEVEPVIEAKAEEIKTEEVKVEPVQSPAPAPKKKRQYKKRASKA